MGGFKSGVIYGSIIGLATALYKRRITPLPATALAFGVANAAFMGSSAYFRNEI